MTRRKRRVIGSTAAVTVLLMMGGGAVAWFTSEAYEVRQLGRSIRQADPPGRQKVLWKLASIRGARAARIARESLMTDPDADVREAAAYALQKMNAPEGFELVRSALLRECPGPVQAKMISYAARLGRNQALSWLIEMGTDSASWAGLGAAIGRIELGDMSAQPVLFDYLKSPDPNQRAFAAAWMMPWIRTMSETIGRHVNLPEKPDQGITDRQVDEMMAWWRNYVTPKLWTDTLAMRDRRDPMRRKLGRLMGARHRAIDYLNIN